MNSLRNCISVFKAPHLMGIINITEDSFSDGGLYLNPDAAFHWAEQLINDGADILDIGGESTRPGSQAISVETELKRVIPVIERIRTAYPKVAISVDTQKSKVARAALDLGIQMVNDISALRFDPKMIEVIAQHSDLQLIIMHMQGQPENMQKSPQYGDVVTEIEDFFRERIACAESYGVNKSRILLDPGIGFGKTLKHNLQILSHLDSFHHLDCPLVLGVSRKGFIAAIDPSSTEERIGGSLASAYIGAIQGVEILRVHDIKAHKQFFQVLSSLSEEVD